MARGTRGIVPSPLHILAASLFALRFGSTMTAVGLPLLVLHRYGAGLDAGLTLALEILPNVVFGPAVGDLVDRSDARRYAIAGPLLAAPFLALLTRTAALWQIQLLALLIGIGYLVGLPARMALRTAVIPPGAETRGNGVLLAAQRVPTLLGPALAALLVPLGYSVLFLVDAGSAIAAALLLCALPASVRPPRAEAGAEAGAGTGPAAALRRLVTSSIPGVVRTVAADRALSALAGTALTYMFAFGMTRLFLAAYTLGRFPHDPALFGVLTAAMGAGAVLGSISAARFDRFSPGRLYVAVNLAEAACWLSTILWHAAAPAVIAIALAGFCESVGTVVFYAEAQTRLPRDFSGRFFGVLIPATDAFSLLGTVTAGAVVASGVTPAAVIIASAMAVPVLALCPLFLRRGLWRAANGGAAPAGGFAEGETC
jgi:MFS family permease